MEPSLAITGSLGLPPPDQGVKSTRGREGTRHHKPVDILGPPLRGPDGKTI